MDNFRRTTMKIVTYNVNGLRQRITQFGSLLKLLDSFDADIICFQETKLRRQELTADVVMADGYESFFSCTRTSDKGRSGYSGVATFCRVKSAFSSCEVALPLYAEEGFTGILGNGRAKKDERGTVPMEGLEEFAREDLAEIDNEGRCLVTDHSHFVLFNIYGPRADANDLERVQFKRKFFDILKKRWEHLLHQGKRIFVVGDLNIAPYAIDRCDAGPDFEKNEFRRWLRSMFVENGGPFVDVFRCKHPKRKDAYICWPSSTGAEQFNFGSRIDHVLYAGSCLHQDCDLLGHDFMTCHVKDCDILTQYKWWKPGDGPRWKGGWSMKLEGSDHAPVFVTLVGISDINPHDTPSLSTRYFPMVRGVQQTIVSVLMKRQVIDPVKACETPKSFCIEDIKFNSSTSAMKRSCDSSDVSGSLSSECHVSSQESDVASPVPSLDVPVVNSLEHRHQELKKKARKNQGSQLSLKSFFKKSSTTEIDADADASAGSIFLNQVLTEVQTDNTLERDDASISSQQEKLNSDDRALDIVNCSSSERERNNAALMEWQRIQQVMQSSIPLCRGHNEPCVSRVVKKAGPNFGRRFYTCPRAEGPASNKEANCGFFRWAASNFKR